MIKRRRIKRNSYEFENMPVEGRYPELLGFTRIMPLLIPNNGKYNLFFGYVSIGYEENKIKNYLNDPKINALVKLDSAIKENPSFTQPPTSINGKDIIIVGETTVKPILFPKPDGKWQLACNAGGRGYEPQYTLPYMDNPIMKAIRDVEWEFVKDQIDSDFYPFEPKFDFESQRKKN